MDIQAILEKILAAHGNDRVKLASLLEINYSTLSLWLSGKRAPSPIQCLVLASLVSGKEKDALQKMAQLSEGQINKIVQGLSADSSLVIQPEKQAFIEWFNNPPESYDAAIKDYILRRTEGLKGTSKPKPKSKLKRI